MTDSSPKKILLVEDEAIIALSETAMIKSFGFEVVPAYSGIEAVTSVQDQPDIKLVLMDIHLGQGMDGADAARSILAFRNLPIIFLTSFTAQEIVEKVRDITHYGYVTKNSGSFLLRSSINMALQLFEAQEKAKENEERYRHLYVSAQRQAQEMALLDLVRVGIARDLDLSDVICNTVEGIARIFAYPLVSLYLKDQDVLRLQYQVGYDQELVEIPIDTGIIGKVVRSGKPILLKNTSDDPAYLAAMPGIISEVCVPLFDRGEVVGAFNVEGLAGLDLTEADLNLLNTLGSHISIAIGRARMYTEVRESEERFRLLFHQAPLGVFQFDSKLNITEVNGRALAFLRMEREEKAEIDVFRVTDPCILPALQKAISGEEGHYEGLYVASGQIQPLWILLETAPMFNEQGHVRAGTAIIQDISERMRMLQIQKKHDDQMSALYATSIEVNSLTDLDRLLAAITRRAADLLDAPMGGLYIMNPGNEGLRLAANHHLTGEFCSEHVATGEGLVGRVALAGSPMTERDLLVQPVEREQAGDSQRVLGVPMRWGGETLGVILVKDDLRAAPFQDDEIMLVGLFAEQAAIAIKNTRLLAESNHRSEELAVLNRIGQTVNSNLELDQVLFALYQQCKQILPMDVFYVAVYDETTGRIKHPLFIDRGNSVVIAPQDIHVDPGLSGEVILSRCTVYLADTMTEEVGSAHQILVTGEEASRSYVGVPLIAQSQVIGVLSIQSYQLNAYLPDQIRLLETIADQAATAINHASLFDKIQETSEYLALLNEITNTALMATDMHSLMQMVADKMGALLHSDGCHITLWDASLEAPVPAAAFGPLREEYPSDKPIPGEITLTESVLKAGHPLAVEDITNSPYMSPIIARRYAPLRSVLALPLMAADQRLGAALIGFNNYHHFTDDEISRGAQAADQIALATAKLRLANTDPLTGLYNRRGLFEVGKREIERFHRYGSPLSVVLLDIDHFKRVNDQYSHAIGDQVLIAVVEMCKKNIRAVDTLGRYGGEEFALLLPETDFEAAQQLAQRLCTSICETLIETPQGNIAITVSIGVTFINAETSGLDMLINRADDAMYAAKRAGRNRVMAFVA